VTVCTLDDHQVSIQDKFSFTCLEDYFALCYAYLAYIHAIQPTRIISPNEHHYIFFQYGETYRHRITRPLNSRLYIESVSLFKKAFERFGTFLDDLRKYECDIVNRDTVQSYLASNEVNQVVYTIQQTVGSIADSFRSPNQARKRTGQLFEGLVKLIIQEVGFECDPRTITIPIPDYPGHTISYELDLVFSRGKAVLAAESEMLIHPDEVVGSVKTTSKDRYVPYIARSKGRSLISLRRRPSIKILSMSICPSLSTCWTAALSSGRAKW
jgi:hypothetical protein